ncbi:MAG: glycerol-3-phosphate 1-O-acyltransferase PlsY [Bacteroidales bacterium]|nr:glycerol-3-phosphate 1-O-acyltransferase PlsY [Bacteroidales bacterium]
MLLLIAFPLLAYLVGSIPNAVWVGRVFYGVDVRNEGSRNAGTTNVIRVLGFKPGLCVLALDLLKGLFPLAVLFMFFEKMPFFEGMSDDFYFWFEIGVALATVVGHVFPVYVGFRGGKGVAALVGVLIMLYPQVFPFVFSIFFGMLFAFRYVSLSSITAAISLPLLQFAFFQTEKTPLLIFAIFITIFVAMTHIQNIKRLLRREESKFVFKKTHYPTS